MSQRETVFHTLKPWYDNQSNTLILGTMPSPKSRERLCYYGHPQNRFWKTLAAVYEESMPITPEECRHFILRHHLALWDVLASCEIEGAEDASIRQPVVNNISFLLQHAPITAVYTTGKKPKRCMTDMYFRTQIYLPKHCLRPVPPIDGGHRKKILLSPIVFYTIENKESHPFRADGFLSF